MTRKLVFTVPCLRLSIKGTAWRTSRQVYLLCGWERHLTGLPHLRVVDGNSKWARYSNLIAFRDRRMNVQLNTNRNLTWVCRSNAARHSVREVDISLELSRTLWHFPRTRVDNVLPATNITYKLPGSLCPIQQRSITTPKLSPLGIMNVIQNSMQWRGFNLSESCEVAELDQHQIFFSITSQKIVLKITWNKSEPKLTVETKKRRGVRNYRELIIEQCRLTERDFEVSLRSSSQQPPDIIRSHICLYIKCDLLQPWIEPVT